MNKAPTTDAAIEEAEGRAAPQLTGRDVFKVLFRRKWIILTLFVTTSVFVAWNTSRIPMEYRAVAKVLLNRGMRNSALDRNISLLTWDETVNSELEIAESSPVIERSQEILYEQAIEDGVEATTIDPANVSSLLLSESNVIGLQYMSLDWSEVQPVADALARAYIEIHEDLFALPDVEEYFTNRVTEAEQSLDELTTRKQQIQEENTIVRITTQQDHLIRELSVTREDLTELERTYAAQKADLDEVRRLFYEENVDIPFETRLHEDQTGMLHILYKLRTTLLEQENARTELLTRYTDQHPLVISLDERIADTRDQMHTEAEQLIRVKESSLAMTRAEINSLRSETAALEQQLRDFPEAERQLENLDRSIFMAERSYAKLLETQVQIGVAKVSSRDYRLSILSAASPPVASNPRDPVRLALVPAFSLLVGISIAFFVETMDHSLKSREDVERHIELPVLTSIPKRRGLSKV